MNYPLKQGNISFHPNTKDGRKKGQLAVLSISCLVYPHSQSFWNWCISHLLNIEEGGKTHDTGKRVVSLCLSEKK
jgi:hypothetical protein